MPMKPLSRDQEIFNAIAYGALFNETGRGRAERNMMSQSDWKSKTPKPVCTPGGPYTSRMGDNLKSKPSGNATASSTVLDVNQDRPSKRRRLPGNSKGGTSKYFPEDKKSLVAPRATHSAVGPYVDMTAKGEAESSTSAARKRRSSSPDLGGISSDAPSPLSNISSPPRPHDFETQEGQERAPVIVADGEATQRLQKRVKSYAITSQLPQMESTDDTESIQSASGFDDPKPVDLPVSDTDKIPVGTVQARKAIYDSQQAIKSPSAKELHVDFKRVLLKSSMKGKAPALHMQPLTQEDSLSAPTPYIVESKKTPKIRGQTYALRLDAYALAAKMDDSKLWLTYVAGLRKLAVKKTVEAQRTLWDLDLETEVEGLKYSRRSEDESYPQILQLTLSKRASVWNHHSIGPRDRDPQLLTFKFERRHANLETGGLKNFIDALGLKTNKREVLDDAASKACWDMATRAQMTTGEANSDGRLQGDRVAQLVKKRNSILAGSSRFSYPIPQSTGSEPSSSRSHSKPLSELGDAEAGADTGPHRVTRRSARLAQEKPDPPEPDELILVYPSSGAGAIHVKTSDLKRLRPLEYLNDTIIEFGLKLWLNELRESHPQLAEEVHVFSSFFYKKLNVKNKEEGFQSVRKWTSKFDLFKKKYIIVPINEHFHWYLAIIHNPESILQPPLPPLPPLPPKSLTRKRKREEEQAMEAAASSTSLSGPLSASPPAEITVVPDSEGETDTNEREVEGMLRRASIGDLAEREERRPDGGTTEETASQFDTVICLNEDTDRGSFADGGSPEGLKADGPVDLDTLPDQLSYPRQYTPMDVDPQSPHLPEAQLEPELEDMPGIDTHGASAASNSAELTSGWLHGVPPSRFHASHVAQQRVTNGPSAPVPASPVHDLDQDSQETGEDSTEESTKGCHIFIMDSLSTPHPAAVRTLGIYLQLEAKDKKGIVRENTRLAQGVNAKVPGQDNFSDCGIYVLHYVQTFMSDPARYIDLILAHKGPKRRNYSMDDRTKDWRAGDVPAIRQQYIERINALSEVWKGERAAREEQQRKEASSTPAASVVAESDSDIEVTEVHKPIKPAAPRKGAKEKVEKERVPQTGSAARIR